MMMRTDFQASGHRPLDMQELEMPTAGGEALPAHARLSKPVARHDVMVTLLGVACTVAVFGLLALLFSLG